MPCQPRHVACLASPLQGDYYFHNRMDLTDKDVAGGLLNKDKAFGITYKVGTILCWGRLERLAARGV